MGDNFSNSITEWYTQFQRNLPWRNTRNPYKVWLSEIILQQTQVVQGLKYYNKFVQKFPKIEFLAAADEQEVLNLWQGLGYYSRARNLHFTSKYIVNELKGEFPNTYSELIKLKGVGHYTAAAIASFCYEENVAVLDGNVFRVLARHFGIHTAINSPQGIREFKALSQELLPKLNASTYNQAIMEFGALQCKHSNPHCDSCPLSHSCEAYRKQEQKLLPFKEKKSKVKDLEIDFYIIKYKEKIMLTQRKESGIWKNLWEFPSIHSDKKSNLDLKNITIVHSSPKIKHLLSHRRILATFHLCAAKSKLTQKNTKWILPADIQDFPIHRLMDKFLESNPNYLKH